MSEVPNDFLSTEKWIEFKEKLKWQIGFARRQTAAADENGDNNEFEAWTGYLSGLRWVESILNLPLYMPYD